ncbi:MAG: ShlB/FhaC/HecB family hemolysin secretion/activation protein [Oceanospirillales bacterium]|nr:ShlB/FhaC/HecB family hemolysin secretion/activation protein [Oceanospirillales bacterium]MBR9886506.1 ShlB/FhaC/HecB family hemolysin secretion/activation protein [Oceanospirillales bacterium]
MLTLKGCSGAGICLSRTFFLSLLFIFMPVAHAASPDAAQLEQLQRQVDQLNKQEQLRQEQLLQEQDQKRRPPGTIDSGVDKVPEVEGAPGQCFEVHNIILEGAMSLTTEEINALTAPFIDRCIGLFEIKELLRVITNYYIEKGYVTTRAYIPQQDLSSGTLKLLIIEGITESINLNGEHTGINLVNIFPGVEGNVLNIRDIEQGLDQINRLQSNSATMELQPGATPGLSRILVSNTPGSRFSGNLSIDNQGSESQGEFRGTAVGGIDNLLGWNDYWSFSLTHNLDDDDGNGLARTGLLNFNIPLGYWTFFGSYSQFDYKNLVTSATQSFRSRGQTLNSNIGLSNVLYRSQTQKVTFSAGLTHTDTKNYIEDSLLVSSSRRLTVANANITSVFAGLGGSWTLDGGISSGLDWFGSEELPDAGTGTVPTGQFTKTSLSASYATPFKVGSRNASFSSRLQTQYSDDYMVSQGQISVGGFYTVRGYDGTSLSGDNGYYLRNDLALNLLPIKDADIARVFGNLQPYLALDVGHIFGRDGQMSGTLSGGGIGLRGSGGLVSFDLFYSEPLNYSDSVGQAYDVESGSLYFKVGVAL